MDNVAQPMPPNPMQTPRNFLGGLRAFQLAQQAQQMPPQSNYGMPMQAQPGFAGHRTRLPNDGGAPGVGQGQMSTNNSQQF